MPEGFRERLIIFTRYPEPGKTKTRLTPVLGEQGAAQLQRRMTEHLILKTRNLSESRSLSIEIRYEGGNETRMRSWLGPKFSYHPQPRGDIGQRMRLAFDEAFQSGADAAVIIGTDIPGITTDILRSAFEHLYKQDLVFGPARDGGYYLIGVKKVCWPKANSILFEGITWSTAEVLSQTLVAAEMSGLNHVQLDTLDDVDRPEDLDIWHRETQKAARRKDRKNISIIIPALNEADNIETTLSALTDRAAIEVILVDGGSNDGTADLAKSCGAKVLTAAPSKAGQMNAGAKAATGDVLLFLHADTQLPEHFEEPILSALSQNGVSAGAFQLCIGADAKGLRFIERVANWRSRRLQAPYGDQGIFVTKALFYDIGGYPEITILEDFELIRRLRHNGKIAILNQSVIVSPRRWLNLGIFKTWILNQIMIAGYLLGVSPQNLSRWYRREKGKSAN
jgi:rSAM/selenodomain-associated transferase 2/rSAM/selenodomain-associated transferase 1